MRYWSVLLMVYPVKVLLHCGSKSEADGEIGTFEIYPSSTRPDKSTQAVELETVTFPTPPSPQFRLHEVVAVLVAEIIHVSLSGRLAMTGRYEPLLSIWSILIA